MEETRRRKRQLKEQHAAQGEGINPASNPDDASTDVQGKPGPQRLLAKSRYREDVHIRGHTSVWGSWFTLSGDKRWGYACCGSTAHGGRCILAPEEPAEEDATKTKRPRTEPRGRRRRRGAIADNSSVTNDAAAGSAVAVAAVSVAEAANASISAGVGSDAEAHAQTDKDVEVKAKANADADAEVEIGREAEAEAEAEPETEHEAPPDVANKPAPADREGW